MKLMLAATDAGEWKNIADVSKYCKYLLSSYFYTRAKESTPSYMDFLLSRNETDDYILDSGAFTHLHSGRNFDVKEYAEEYVAFVNRYEIKRYIELDLGKIMSYEKVKELRRYLEAETGRKSVPVWHSYLPYDEFKKMVHEYDYVAIGGMVGNEIPRDKWHVLRHMTDYARQRGVKVHGLGFTGMDSHKFGFYSVDSSSWTSGRRYGAVDKWDDQEKRIKKVKKPANTRVDYGMVDRNNFIEWCKFQRYVDKVRG